MLADGDSMVLDSGSTTYALAGALRAKHDLTLVTNDIRIAHLVADYPGVRLLLTGGELLSSTYTIFGDHAVDFLSELRLDWCFLGADAIDVDTGITNTNTLEVPLKRAMLESARATVVVADSSKFGRRALVRVADVEQIDHILTDEELDESAARHYGTRLVRVPIVAVPPASREHASVGQPIPGPHPDPASEAI
jgi:DeoR/GlpR family transcriptional regulator of sugar metabolism